MESNQFNSPNSFGKHKGKDKQIKKNRILKLTPICNFFNQIAFNVHINDIEVATMCCAIDIWKNEQLLLDLIDNTLKAL